MVKKVQDLKPDTVLKNYWSNNEQFADLFNAVLFSGRQVIRPEELEDADTEESYIMEHRECAESISSARDIIKIRKISAVYGVEFVMIGMENQEHIHYAMPMRVMGYDYSIYKKQYDRNARKLRKAEGMNEDEFLSGMKRTDRFVPVITMVIYYGEKPWDGATTLHGMLAIPEEIAEFVNDYKMLLVEARDANLQFHNVNNRDLFRLLAILRDKSGTLHEMKKKAIEYAKENEVDRNVVMTVAGATNCKIDYNAFGRKENADMWTIFEETRAEGRAEGKTEGKAEGIIETGLELGLSETDILERLQCKLQVSMETAKEYLKEFGRQPV